ncbi:glycosyltransferase family 4 protein [Costertonia aggregata]|uniref:Glycosyltransferase family 4 protein n=1 Tax=Costertonia aggregata TaxID=343403 RepID=A0A7H9AT02_9FLAO|nr:glycosyltransferase family 4 protein [Costertonia aggregata]QLG46325.1 glycosyltransferase family 4 protein [Costertonia aggregata]
MRRFLRRHYVFYHTSWPVWDGSFYPKKKFDGKWLKNLWYNFLKNDVAHIFSVTQFAKSELMVNYTIRKDKISVVYHSYETAGSGLRKNTTSANPCFVYVGRLIEKKGLLELLDFFKENPNHFFTVVGDGHLKQKVEEYAYMHDNIKYMGYVNDKEKLMEIYKANDYFLLNSKRVEKWEELFGMVLIEAMSCGVVPIATNHVGPKEIVDHAVNGYITTEEGFVPFLESIKNQIPSAELAASAKEKGKRFLASEIKENWRAILVR